MKESARITLAVAVGAVFLGLNLAAHASTAVVGPVRNLDYFNAPNFEDQQLNDQLWAFLGGRPKVVEAAPVVTAVEPVKCVPAGSVAPAPEPAPVMQPGPIDYGLPADMDPITRANMIAFLEGSAFLRSRMSAPVIQAPAPQPSAPICPEEPVVAAMSITAFGAPLDPMAGSLPSLQSTSIEPMSVPEPGTLGLLGIGLAGLGLSRRRRKA